MGDLEKRKTNGLPADSETNYFESYGDAATSRPIEGELLKFNRGDYLAGRENREVPHGTRLVVDMKTLQVGWQHWDGGFPGEARMGFVAEGFQPARRQELGETDKSSWEKDAKDLAKDPWQFANMVVMRSEKGDDVFTFVTGSRGGLDAIGELCKEYGKHIRQHPNDDPVLELDSSSYLHPDRSIGRVQTPVLKVVDWIKKDGDTAEPPMSAAAAKPPKSAATRF
jgi:hypothetical protein